MKEFRSLVACLPLPGETRQFVYQAIWKFVGLFTVCYERHQSEVQRHIATTPPVLLPGPLKVTKIPSLELSAGVIASRSTFCEALDYLAQHSTWRYVGYWDYSTAVSDIGTFSKGIEALALQVNIVNANLVRRWDSQ
jgi:hypothetical protein